MKDRNGNIKLDWGTFAPPITEQLKAEGLSLEKETAKKVEDVRTKTLSLHINGWLTEAETHRVLNRLAKEISKRLYKDG